jgi:hypothetical protein
MDDQVIPRKKSHDGRLERNEMCRQSVICLCDDSIIETDADDKSKNIEGRQGGVRPFSASESKDTRSDGIVRDKVVDVEGSIKEPSHLPAQANIL